MLGACGRKRFPSLLAKRRAGQSGRSEVRLPIFLDVIETSGTRIGGNTSAAFLAGHPSAKSSTGVPCLSVTGTFNTSLTALLLRVDLSEILLTTGGRTRKVRDGVRRNFILQQGFVEPAPEVCPRQYSALHFQPRAVLLWLLAGILFQSTLLFSALCAVLLWSALLPKLNPFDAVYNWTFGNREGAFHITPAPAPRRTAQAIAGTLALVCALLLYSGLSAAAYVVEGIFLAAVLALTLGGFCLGSFMYHLLRGRGDFARKTLPWVT